MVETATDRLIALARKHGWTVNDNRQFGTVWFQRGIEWAHLGTDAGHERVLSAQGGIRGRPTRYWVAGHVAGLDADRRPNRGQVLAEHL
ncbi:hypothetical protein, partial [Mycolicibacterium mageritense]|uniref:hypothetical protein n=1 Tax=Mycolicibacterium mageritense TaxID=53462 RepID=UPI001E4CE4C0